MKGLAAASVTWLVATSLYILFRRVQGLVPSAGGLEVGIIMFGPWAMASMRTSKEKLTADLFLPFGVATTAVALLAVWWHPKEAVDIFVALAIAWTEVVAFMIWFNRSDRRAKGRPTCAD